MLVNQATARTWNAVSAINVHDGSGTPVMYMNASYNGNGVNFGESIADAELYLANKQTVDADYAAFKESVWADIGE